MKKINWLKLLISIAIPLIIGFLGSVFTTNSVKTWFVTIIKPSFNPPNWLFAPVWTFLFILIGISLYLVWDSKKENKKFAYYIFAFQLIFNLLWSILFFGLHNPLLALLDIFVLWVLILINIILFYKISKSSAYLLMPYLLWVTFATILNFSIFLLN